jgi:D-sedoheptulose 7-phosphate isomerase
MSLLIENELWESSSVIAAVDPQQIEAIVDAILASLRQGKKVILFGNGGSAADAVHLAAEFSGRYLMERPALNGMALSSLSSITGIGNDYGYEKVFVRQLEACMNQGDVVIGISTSGTSKNVVLAIQRAKELGAVTAAFTGAGGVLKDLVDHPLVIPSKSTPRIQEAYLCAGHIICGLVEKGMFGKKAVFVDRDDTIAKDVPYCSKPEDLHLFPGVGISIKKLNDAGYLVVLVTNQSGVARGYFSEETLGRIHRKMLDDLEADGARIDAIYYCPHHPDEGCDCRKPRTGLVERAVRELGIDLRSSYVIGDGEHDMAMAEKAGCRGLKVGSSLDFNTAVERILRDED